MLRPLLARFPQPLALIEVGASAGLCLPRALWLPLWRASAAPNGSDIETAGISLPDQPRDAVAAGCLARRADLNPLDPSDPEDRAWPEALVWPEQTDRLSPMRAALAIPAAEKPRVLKAICVAIW